MWSRYEYRMVMARHIPGDRVPGDSNCSLHLLLTILFLVALQGCSVMLALKQPEKKNLNVLEPGTPRSTVIIGHADQYR